MTRILTIIALLFATPAWAGEVDGNSFYCPPNGLGTLPHYALQFQNGDAYVYQDSGLEEFTKYDVTAGFVLWARNNFGHFRMDRKTLDLFIIGTEGLAVAQWQCQFMNIADARAMVKQIGERKDREARKGNKF